jgi:hypothetical protein
MSNTAKKHVDAPSAADLRRTFSTGESQLRLPSLFEIKTI